MKDEQDEQDEQDERDERDEQEPEHKDKGEGAVRRSSSDMLRRMNLLAMLVSLSAVSSYYYSAPCSSYLLI